MTHPSIHSIAGGLSYLCPALHSNAMVDKVGVLGVETRFDLMCVCLLHTSSLIDYPCFDSIAHRTISLLNRTQPPYATGIDPIHNTLSFA